jgi:hypothetical protein
MSSKRYWKIEGYDSTDKTFEKVLPEGSLSESEIVVLLQRLSARHLDEDEIVSSSLRQNATGYASHLERHIDQGGRRIMIRIGDSSPYYVASIWEDDELSHNKD